MTGFYNHGLSAPGVARPSWRERHLDAVPDHAEASMDLLVALVIVVAVLAVLSIVRLWPELRD